MRSALIVAVAVLTIAAAPPGKGNGQNTGQGNGQANGQQGCSSIGGSGSNPGQWYQSLQDNPLLEGLTPAEMAELEDTTPGWVGYGQTPNVGAAIREFCGN
jgi:hypothetical protein